MHVFTCPICHKDFEPSKEQAEVLKQATQSIENNAPPNAEITASVLCLECSRSVKHSAKTDQKDDSYYDGITGPFGSPPDVMFDAMADIHGKLASCVGWLHADPDDDSYDDVVDQTQQFYDKTAQPIQDILGDPEAGDPRPNNAQIRSAIMKLLSMAIEELKKLDWPEYGD